MTTAIIPTRLNTIQLPPGTKLQLQPVSWQQFESILQELGDSRATRISYGRGVLEIKMPSKLHEIINRLLAKIIFTLAEELNLEIVDLGSTTLSRQDLDQGIEPDTCFYIQNAALVQGLNPDIPDTLPPDLAVEVDISNKSDSKLSIYQALGVTEVWLYQQKEGVKINLLQEGKYRQANVSRALPIVNVDLLSQWLRLRETHTDLAVVRVVRQFCRENKG
jgi:Uma2 family endonuclease